MKKILLLIALPFIMLTFFTSTANALSPTGAACGGLKQLGSADSCSKTTTNSDVSSLVKTAINLISYIVGIASIIVIIFAGFRFATAGGDTNTISSARNQLIYAVIGLVIVVIAQLISHIALHAGNSINSVIIRIIT